jgi:GntP family gluconate:H+ symporter
VHPIAILLVGIITVLGLIIFVRANAFLALIAAAMLVSLLSPGEFTETISRVAQAFGAACGDIGIVIALAAIVGQCMMDSGAADRLVYSLLRVFGEKRASWALMGSSYALAIPVFFDTVFYLMAPLAKSLYKHTSRDFLLYVMAICAGGAITHTLVPPTPGPLVAARLFGVDLGAMILVGILVSAPVAVIGLIYGMFINRAMPIPLRELPVEEDLKPLSDSALPPLFWSIMPVALPVVLISASTLLSTLATREANATEAVAETAAAAPPLDTSRPIATPEQARERQWLDNPRSPLQHAARWAQLIGDGNFALFLSAVIAMALLVRQRGLSLNQLGQTVERALMSGGVIILIVAAGGAFGGMLQKAGIGEALTDLLGGKSVYGTGLILLAFALSSVIKIAQGSSTVAMITAASIITTMYARPSDLPYHPVYLALATGAGSLVCAWMNDAGFWIVAKMSGLTELEALKSWTILLAIMGVASLGMVLLLANVMPLVD